MMELHELKSVSETDEVGVYSALVDLTDINGDRYETNYISREGDNFGLAPKIREEIMEWIAADNPVEPYVAPEVIITSDMVNAERDRRIAIGSTFNVAGYGDIPVTGRPSDQIVLLSRLNAAQALKAAGDTTTTLVFRDAQNVTHELNADEMIEMVTKATAWVEATMMVSWAMKDGVEPFEDGIPEDYADDAYWP